MPARPPWRPLRSLAPASLLVLLTFAAACSNAPEVSDPAPTDAPAPTASSAPAEGATTAPPVGPTTTATAADPPGTSADGPAPLRPYAESPPPTSAGSLTSVWVSRTSMTATEIAIQWSAPEGAAEYELHRLPRDSDVMPGAEAMTEASFVESVEAVGAYEDPSVREGEQYWFGVRGLAADGTLLAHGWHAVDAVTDEQPPAVVGDLTAVVVDGEIVVTWTRPTDNYELASYLVSRAVEGEELESVGAAYNPDQTTFIDDPATLSGAVTYSIVALDVHWNKSDPATVVVNVS